MDVLMLKERRVTLPSGATQTFPAGWSGDVPDLEARQWVEEGAAERLSPAAPVAAPFTPRQAAILAGAADEIERQAQAQNAPDLTVDPDEQGGEIDLNAMTDEQLDHVGEQLGIKRGRKSRERFIESIERKAKQLDAADAAADAAHS